MASNFQNYFSHDSNARNDTKILNLRAALGAEGYGIYFMILERLRESTDYTSVTDYNAIAFDLRVASGTVKKVVEDFGLFSFTEDGARFYSESFLARMQFKDDKKQDISNKRRAAANKRWEKEKSNSNAKAMQMQAKKMQNDAKDRIVKDRIVKDRIEMVDLDNINQLLTKKINEESYHHLQQSIDPKVLLDELNQSTWLRENGDFINPSPDFLARVMSGKYRDYTKSSKNKFHNFEATSSDLSPQELEDLARRKVEAYGGDK